MEISRNDALKRLAIAYGLDEEAFFENPIGDMLKDNRVGKYYDDASKYFTMGKIIDDGANFVYDFKSGIIFDELFAYHAVVMQAIIHEIRNTEVKLDTALERIKQIVARKDDADAYIEAGLGAFRSSVGRYIIIGEDVALPQAFRAPYLKGIIKRL